MQTIYYTERLKEVFDGHPWLGSSLSTILKMTLAHDPNFKLNNGNSIANLLEHILNWRIFVIEKLNGSKEFDIEINSKLDWNKGHIYTKEETKNIINKINKSNHELILILQNKNDNNWLNERVAGKDYDIAYMLDGIIEHDLYHMGQIALLIKAAKQFEPQ